MNRKGFVFIETIIVIVVVSTALLSLYSIYNNAIKDEQDRLYNDDTAYIYRNYYVAHFLLQAKDNKDNIKKILTDSSLSCKIITENDIEQINLQTLFLFIKKSFYIDKIILLSFSNCDIPNLDDDIKAYIKNLYVVNGNSYIIIKYTVNNEYKYPSEGEDLQETSFISSIYF